VGVLRVKLFCGIGLVTRGETAGAGALIVGAGALRVKLFCGITVITRGVGTGVLLGMTEGAGTTSRLLGAEGALAGTDGVVAGCGRLNV
jgi:hypothetical protein